MALAGAAAATGTAGASTVPVVYGSAAALPWQASVKPGNFYFGEGVAPEFRNLNWSSWNGTSAQATGRLWTVKPGCVPPTYKCAFNTRYAQVTLSVVRSHHGTRYYARMAVRFYSGRQVACGHGLAWLQRVLDLPRGVPVPVSSYEDGRLTW